MAPDGIPPSTLPRGESRIQALRIQFSHSLGHERPLWVLSTPSTTMPVPLMTIWIRGRPSMGRGSTRRRRRSCTRPDGGRDRMELVGGAELAVGLAAPANEEDADRRREHAGVAAGL